MATLISLITPQREANLPGRVKEQFGSPKGLSIVRPGLGRWATRLSLRLHRLYPAQALSPTGPVSASAGTWSLCRAKPPASRTLHECAARDSLPGPSDPLPVKGPAASGLQGSSKPKPHQQRGCSRPALRSQASVCVSLCVLQPALPIPRQAAPGHSPVRGLLTSGPLQ